MIQKRSWFLFHRMERKEVPGLTLDGVVELLRSEDTPSRLHWFAWQSGMQNWTPVMDIREIVEKLAVAIGNPLREENTDPIPPPFPGLKMDVDSRRPSQKGNGAERRKHQRFDVRLRSIVMDGGSAFRTFTNNISLGGLLLEDQVPIGERGPTRILLQSPDGKENIAVQAVWIEDSRGRLRLSFEPLKEDQITQLETWFKAQGSQQKIA